MDLSPNNATLCRLTGHNLAIIRMLRLTQTPQFTKQLFKIQVLSASKTTKPPDSKEEPALKQTTPPPADSFVYKVPEYFSYSTFSYYDLEEEVVNKRLPQPRSAD